MIPGQHADADHCDEHVTVTERRETLVGQAIRMSYLSLRGGRSSPHTTTCVGGYRQKQREPRLVYCLILYALLFLKRRVERLDTRKVDGKEGKGDDHEDEDILLVSSGPEVVGELTKKTK